LSSNSSWPRIFHSSGLTKCSNALGSSIISFKSLSLLSQTLIDNLRTFSLTFVYISPPSIYALSLNSLIYYFKWHSAFTAISSFSFVSFFNFNSPNIFSYCSLIFLALSFFFLASSNYNYSCSSSNIITSLAFII
jgi:hypothetical protein